RMFRDEETPESISRVENIEELLNSVKEFSERGAEAAEGDMELQGTLDEFMQEVALFTDADKDDDEGNNKVSLMTIHAAKGLEFPYVFIVGLEENLFPSVQSVSTRTDLEEERRLFYVALTRAMKKVTLSYAESRYRWGQFTIAEPSRFLEEIDESLLDIPHKTALKTAPADREQRKSTSFGSSIRQRNLKTIASATQSSGAANFQADDTTGLMAGMEVEHPKFGKGKVVAVEGSGPNKKATVFFSGVGKKNLLLRFAKLRIL
ncbi:MAG TPA: ATP-dependent DNA helicase, partial [Bacteroidetes bacterium]|nr:ATP-dependent DNA helicase [Bacteroidota bacterium]